MTIRKWFILVLSIITLMSLATYVGTTGAFFVDDEQSTDDALGIRWGLFVLNDGFETTGVAWDDYWDENGATTWVQNSAKPHSGTYNAKCDNTNSGFLTSDEIEGSTTDNITVSFWFNTKSIEAGDCLVQRYNGASYVTWYDLTSYPTYVNNAWCEFNEVITDSEYLIAGFRLRFDTSALLDIEEADIDDVVITTDTIPPAAPTGLAATLGNEQITLDWNDNTDTDLWGYNVYRSTDSGGSPTPYAKINGSPVLTSAYTDHPLYGGGTYYYVVVAVDYGNNESGYSNEDNATANNIAPSAPTSLNATAGDEEISLDWNDNIETDVVGYNVYRSLTSGSGYSLLPASPVVSSAYTDTELYGGGTYYYVVTATDNLSLESSDSNEASATANNIAPAAPTGLNATAGNEQISLDWDNNSETDVVGYNVYRSLTSGGSYSKINDDTTVATNSYTDTPLYGGGTYYYKVKAVDADFESDYSNEDSATANNIAPLAPTGLIATGGNEEISLDWDNNDETDVVGYNVYRSTTSGGSYSQVNGSLVLTSDYTDTGLYSGGTYYYKVKAMDASLESSYSNEDFATANTVPPADPTGLVATDGVEEISLVWNVNTEPDLDGYNVFRSATDGGPYSQVNIGLVATNSYTDTGLFAGGTYYYVIAAVDLGDNESGYSNEDSATASTTPPAAPTGLVATPGDSQVALDWADNTEGDLASYNVYRGLTSGNYTYIDNVVAPTSNYTDTGRSNGATYYYVVTAVDDYSAESDYSNEVSTAPVAPPISLIDDGFEGTPWDANWDGNGITDWAHANWNVRTDIWAVLHSSGDTYLTTDDMDTTAADNITISFWFRLKRLGAGPLDVEIYNGSSYVTLHNLCVYPGVVATGTYYQYNEDITDSQYFRSDFRLRIDGSGLATDAYIDDVLITMVSIPPVEPTGLVATAGDEEIGLDWNDNSEGDLGGYNVYRSLTSGGSYSKINGSLVTSSNYTDTGLTNDITYYYVVTAVDLGSNESAYSIEDSATPVNAPPAAPTGLTATPGDLQVSLDWNNNTEPDLAGYNVYRGEDTGGPYDQVNVSLVATNSYTDTGLTGDVTYYYVVTAVDNLSAQSGYSNEDSTIPNIAPAAPTGLIATAGDEEVGLNWNNNSEPDLAGYNVYRSEDTGGPYDQVNVGLVSTSNYTDTGLTNDITYHYVVKAVDDYSAESGYSSEASATPGDPPPAAPIGLAATPDDKEVSLDWNDNTEPDLAGYNVYRGLTSGDYTYIDNVVAPTSNYTDTGLTGGETYYYVVTAVDTLANESGYSSEVSATPTDPPPAAPTTLVANPGDKQVSLGWDDNTEGDLAGYNVYRSTDSGGSPTPYTKINGSLVAASDYTDTGLTGGVTYYYVVKAVDLASNESNNSDEASATPTDPPPAAPTTLVANPGNTEVSLSWDDNSEPDLAGYNVYRGLSSGNYTYIDNVVAPTSSYTDTGLTNGVIYYYVVTAIDLASNESGNSNEDSAMPFNPPITLLDDNFEGTPWDANWDGNGTTDWQVSYDGGGYGGTGYSAHHASGNTYLTSDDLDASAADNITVTFWFNIKLLNKGPLYIQTYNGTAYNNWYDLVTYPGVAKNTWCYFSQTITDAQYFESNFRIRFDGSTETTDSFIDDVLIMTNQ